MLIRSLYQDLMPDLHKVRQPSSDLLRPPQTAAGARCCRVLVREVASCERSAVLPPLAEATVAAALLFSPLQPPGCLSILHHDWIPLQC